MQKIKYVFFSVLAVALTVIPAFAQAGAGAGSSDNDSTVSAYKAIAAGIGFGIAAGLGALGQGKIGASAVEGTARNPSASGKIQTIMILGLALIESLVLFALLVVFLKL